MVAVYQDRDLVFDEVVKDPVKTMTFYVLYKTQDPGYVEIESSFQICVATFLKRLYEFSLLKKFASKIRLDTFKNDFKKIKALSNLKGHDGSFILKLWKSLDKGIRAVSDGRYKCRQ